MKQYFFAAMDSPSTLHDSVTDAVGCLTVLLKTVGGNLPVVKLYMTYDKKFVTHWLEPECRDDDDVRELLGNARKRLESGAEIPWETVLYNMLTRAERRHENLAIGYPESRLRELLASIPDESWYQALVRYVSGNWPDKRAKRVPRDENKPDGYRHENGFLAQVKRAMDFLRDPVRIQYLVHGESDLKWDLGREAQACLRANGAVVWADVTALDEKRILGLDGMTLDIASQIRTRMKKERTARNG